MNKYLELVEGSFNESHFNKQTSQIPYVAYSIQDDRVIYTKIPNYLCLEPIDSNNQLALAKIGDYSNIQYSFDKKNWSDFTTDPTNPLNLTYISVDKPIYLRGNNPNGILNSTSLVGCKLISSGKYNVSGDVTTLLNEKGDVKDLTPYGEESLGILFGSIPSNISGLPIDLPGVDIVDASKLILPSTVLTGGCYAEMFHDCASLTTAPELPATTLAYSCYNSMFHGCVSLTAAPKLPATTLAKNCYAEMFRDCTSLVAAPELPATELADYCYLYMFYGCTSLTAAPELPATTLANSCYQYMFIGCTKLDYIKCLATDISASHCTDEWVVNVSPTGTFVKHPNMSNWSTSESGIPRGWRVEDVVL